MVMLNIHHHFFLDKHSEQYIKQQNNIGRWNEIATINVI